MSLPIETFRSLPFKGLNEMLAPHLLDDGESPFCKGIQSEPIGAISKQKGNLRWITTDIPPNPVNGICAFKPAETQEIDVISGSEFRRYNVNGVYQTPNKTGIRTVLFSCDKDNKTIYTHSYGGSFDITNAVESFTVANNPYGVAFDGTNLWYCDQVLNKLYKLSGISGVQLAEISGPTDANISGLCWDGTNLWCCGYTDNKVYKFIISTGVFTYVFTVTGQGTGLTGISYDGTYLWITIEVDPKIVEYTTVGVFISSLIYPLNIPASKDWRSIAISSTGQYQSIVAYNDYIYTSSDCGIIWTAKMIDVVRAWYSIAMSSTGQYQSAVAYNDYIYTSSDYGMSWMPRNSSRAWMAIAMSSTGQYQSAVVWIGQIYISSDYGVTWIPKDSNRNWRCIAISSTGQYQSAAGDTLIYTSSDYGMSWMPRDSSRIWIAIAMSSTGQYQTAVVPGGYIYISSDYGVTWIAKMIDVVRAWEAIAMSSTGQYQSAVVSGGYIYISSDYGVTWIPKDSNRNWRCIAISSTGQYQSAVVYSDRFFTSSDFGVTWKIPYLSGISVKYTETEKTFFIVSNFLQQIYQISQTGELLNAWNSPSSHLSDIEYSVAIPLSAFSTNKFDFVVFMNTLFFCNGSYVYKWTGSGNFFTIVYDASNQTKYLALFENRLLSAGHNASDVCYSNLLDPETGYIDNYIPVNPDDGDKITGMIVHSNNLIVFKEKSKWRMSPTGDYDNPFYLTKIDDVGTISHHSLIIVNYMVYFCNLNGVYRFTGASSEKISTKIDASYKTWLKGTLTSIDVVYVKELNQIRWTIQSSLTDDPSTIVYNLLTDSWFVLNDYAPQGGGWISTNFCVIKPDETSATEIILASSKNYLMQTNDGDSFDVQTNKTIPSVFTSKVFDFGVPNKQKTIKRGYFTVKNEVSSYNITLSVSVDGKAFEVLSPVVVSDPTGGDKITKLIDLKEKTGKTFQFKFENNGENQPWTLLQYIIEHQVLPRII